MTSQPVITLVVVQVASVLFHTERLRADLVVLLVVVALVKTGALSPSEAFFGFAGSVVVTIVSIFILALALRTTGIAEQAGGLLEHVAGTSESRLVMVVTLADATGASRR
jgi:di/tricarboxylate transporter